MKTDPLSDVMWSGRPKRAIQAFRRADAQVDVVVFSIGTASGHLVERSMIVKRYWWLSEGGSGPTMSTCMWANRLVG